MKDCNDIADVRMRLLGVVLENFVVVVVLLLPHCCCARLID